MKPSMNHRRDLFIKDNSKRGVMRFVALSMICLMFVSSFSGCMASEDDLDSGQYIDDEEGLIDYIEEGICGDIDGDGVPDCPLSGYI
mgnify:FL=1